MGRLEQIIADGRACCGRWIAIDCAAGLADDLASNRTRKVQTGYQAATTDYTYNERDQLVSETTGGIATTYGYDANGATTLKSTGGQDTTYTWDLRGRLMGVDAPGAENDGYFEYDTRGVRVLAYVGGVVTGYVIDERNPTGYAKPVEEYEGGAVSRAWSWATTSSSRRASTRWAAAEISR